MFGSFFETEGDEFQDVALEKTIPIKIIIVGAKNVGKTTIGNALSAFTDFDNARSFGGSGKSHMPRFQSTFVADVFKKDLKISSLLNALEPNIKDRSRWENLNDNDNVALSFWDTAGYEIHDDLPPTMLLNGASVVMLCFSMDDTESVSKLDRLIEHCARSNVSDDCVYFALGNKLDVFRDLCENAIKSNGDLSNVGKRKNLWQEGKRKKRADKVTSNNVFNREESEPISFLLGGCDGYARAKLLFFSNAEGSLISFCKKLDEANESARRRPCDAKATLLSFTSSFCDTRSVHNPVYCILYAVALHLEKILPPKKTPHADENRFSSTKTTTHCDNATFSNVIERNNYAYPRANKGIVVLDDTNFVDVDLNEKTKFLRDGELKKDECCA